MLKFKNLIILLVVMGMALVISSCTGGQKEEGDEVSILYPNWAEGIAFSHLVKTALESKGYDVTLTNLEPGLIYGELSKENSKGDVFLDAWLPNTHEDYWDDYGDKLITLGESFSDGTTGLVVP